MKSYLLFLPILMLCFGWGTLLVAGTLSVPSRFVLQRPLNPALITEVSHNGIAGIWITEAFNSYTKNKSCENELLNHCNETGYGLLGYTHWEGYFFQLEGHRQLSSKEGRTRYTNIKSQREQDHFLSIVATQWERFSLGILIQTNRFAFKKRQSFVTGKIENGGIDRESSLSLGGVYQFGNRWYASLYRETILNHQIHDVHGRRINEPPSLGLFGFGLGGKFHLFENWDLTSEFFQLIQDKPGEQNSLIGGELDIAWKQIASYATFVYDANDNYYERSGSGIETVKLSAGVAWYGDHFQVQLGRDTRFFDGLDGGVKLTVGYRF